MEDPHPVENVARLGVFMFQTSNNSQLLRRVLWINAELTIIWSLKHKNTQPSYFFNRENPQNSEPQFVPRRGLDFIALIWSFKTPSLLCRGTFIRFLCILGILQNHLRGWGSVSRGLRGQKLKRPIFQNLACELFQKSMISGIISVCLHQLTQLWVKIKF